MTTNPEELSQPKAEAADGSWPRWWVWSLVLTALLAGFGLRFLCFSCPPYDIHSFRQTQTLSTIEDFHAHGIDLLHPKTLYMGDPGVFVLELPVFQALAALGYDCFGPHWEVVRSVNILFGILTAWILFKITDFFLGRTTALITVLIYWLAPLHIFYHRSTIMDPMAVFFALTAFYSLTRFLFERDFTPRAKAGEPGWRVFTIFVIATWLVAMIKTLYLWPAVLLFAKAALDRKFKPDSRMLKVLAVFAVSGFCFLAWNRYAAWINKQSPFTGGIDPTSLLGSSQLFTADFYKLVGPRTKWWVGGVGALLYPIGLWAAWTQQRDRVRAALLWLIILVPPSYILCFANINRPHDYYQLIITPFLAVVPAMGLQWLASRFLSNPREEHRRSTIKWLALGLGFLFCFVALPLVWWKMHNPANPTKHLLFYFLPPVYFLLFAAVSFSPRGLNPARRATLRRTILAGVSGFLVLVSVLLYLIWMRPDLDAPLLKLQALCAGKVTPGKTAMVFVGEETGGLHDSDLPHFIYATRLWGFGRSVTDMTMARQWFEKLGPAFPKLEYILFYGTRYPDWVPEQQFRLTVRDDQDQFYVFQRTTD